jgi:hypothetical protein
MAFSSSVNDATIFCKTNEEEEEGLGFRQAFRQGTAQDL